MKTILKPPLNPTQRSATVTTNLYELIEAVQNQVGPRTMNSSLPQSCISCVPTCYFPLQHGSKPLQLTSA